MAYDTSHLLTVGHAKTIYDNLKSANDAIARNDNTNTKYNTVNRGNILPQSIFGWHYGSIATSTGADNGTSPVRLRSDYLPVTANTLYKCVGTGYAELHFYNSDKTWISRLGNWKTGYYTFKTPANTAYMRFLLKNGSAGTDNFTPEGIAAIDLACYPVVNPLDTELHSDNVFDAFCEYPDTASSHSVTFTWDDTNRRFNVNGTSNATSASDPARVTLYDTTLPSCIKKGAIYKCVIDSEDSNIHVFFSERKNGTSRVTYDRDSTFYLYIVNDCDALRVRVQTVNGSAISNKKFAFRLEYQEPATMPIHIPVMQYNVGCYNHGYLPSAEHVPPATSQTLAQLKAFFAKYQADIISINEGQETLLDTDLETETDMNTAIYNYQWPYYATAITNDYPTSPSLHMRYPVIWTNSTTDSSNRCFVYALLNIHGVPVIVASAHFSPSAEDRGGEFASAVSIIRTSYPDIEHIIILGDYNAGNGSPGDEEAAQDEYDIVLEAGFHSANGSWWGLIDTYGPNKVYYLDNIAATPNIDITTYEVPDVYSDMPSDHMPLMCDLVLYPDNKAISR